MKRLIVLMIILLSIAANGFSQEETNRKENWYTYWGIGYASIQYPKDLQDFMNALDNYPGVDRSRVSMDIFGFYWPVNQHHTAVGFVVNSVGDRLTYKSDWVQINQYIYGASMMHYFDNSIGRGFFLRGDIGIAKILTLDSDRNSDTSDNGIGFLVGGGYGFNMSPGTRLLINFNYSHRKVEGDAAGTLGITVGGMF